VSELPVRVLIAEDDDAFAALVRATLDSDPRFETVGRAASGDEAVSLVGELHPELVVMDISMPSCDGIEATRMITELDGGQNVVIYTASDEYDDLVRAEDAGATGFLNKDAVPLPELADALYVLHTNHEHAYPDPDA